MKHLFFTLLLALALPFNLSAQEEFELPDDIILKEKEDYKAHEGTIVNACKWLEENPIGTQQPKRRVVNGFVMKYAEGSPKVTINISENLLALFMKNGDLLCVYYARYCTNYLSNDSTKEADLILASLKSVITAYNSAKIKVKDKKMEAIKNMSEADLIKYVDEKLLIKKK
jgi:hypothetical protein